MFDSTIGTGTITMPYGGKYSLTPQEGMAAKIPVEHGVTNTCSIMTYGCTPEISKWSPFHGGAYAVIESIAKLVAMGGDFRKTHLSFQEYFERLNDVPEKWGKPFTALLGAFEAQIAMGTPAIGGKDLIAIGVKPGPMIGQILNSLLEDVLDDPHQNDKETLTTIARAYLKSYSLS